MEIDLNKLMNYKSIAYANETAQLGKVREEFKELLAEVRETSTFKVVKNRDNFIAEGLDLITATVNLLLLSGLTEQDFEKHIAKLESYKNGKYKKYGELIMIDEAELFYKIENKQFELDYNNTVTKSIKEYYKAKGQIEALEWVKRLIAEECEDEFMVDNTVELGKEWD